MSEDRWGRSSYTVNWKCRRMFSSVAADDSDVLRWRPGGVSKCRQLEARRPDDFDRRMCGGLPKQPVRRAAHQVRAGHQPQDRQSPRPDDPAIAPAAGGSGDRVMDRRAFIGTLAGGLLAAPLVAEAQQGGKTWRVGFLSGGGRPHPSCCFLTTSPWGRFDVFSSIVWQPCCPAVPAREKEALRWHSPHDIRPPWSRWSS